MFLKAFGSLLLLAFFCIQLGSSLDCASCNSPQNCKSPGKINCNFNNANQTTAHLNQNFRENLVNMTSSKFDCFVHNYTAVHNNVTYMGCIYNNINVCSLTPKDGNLRQMKCKKCSGNMCNPAGTFSSSMMTLFASIIVVSVYKVLNF